jgi:hypothetical protein
MALSEWQMVKPMVDGIYNTYKVSDHLASSSLNESVSSHGRHKPHEMNARETSKETPDEGEIPELYEPFWE